jgi:hypothetical protein
MELFLKRFSGDWDNYYKAACDAVVDAKIGIPNDNLGNVLDPLPCLRRPTRDMINPRMEITIEEWRM